MNIPNKEEAKIIIAELLSEPIRRKILIEKCVAKLKLPADVIKDTSPDKPFNQTKCIFGHALTELINVGILVQNDGIVEYREKLPDKRKTTENAKRDIKIDKTLRELLSVQSYTRKELLSAVAVKLKADKDFVKVVKADAGRLLNEAVKIGEIVKTDNVYALPVQGDEAAASEIQPVPIKDAPSKPQRGQTVNSKQIQGQNSKTNSKNKASKINCEDLLLKMAPEEFVNKTVQMLDAWYKANGYTDVKSKNIDGSQDGGIDGIIKGFDGMGYRHKILIQVKHISGKKETAKLVDIRRFCGVVACENDATVGLFVTNRKYTQESEKFVNNFKVKYFKLIDGNLWWKLAKDCDFVI